MVHRMKKTVEVDRNDIKKIVDYMWDDEKKNYEENWATDEEKPKNHIFATVMKLGKKVGKEYKPSEDLVEM